MGSKIYPQNQAVLDCIMPSIPLKHKRLSIILIWVSVSHKLVVVVSKKQVKKKYMGKSDMVLGKKVAIFYWECGRNSAHRDGQKRPWLDSRPSGRVFEPHPRHCAVVLEQDTFILA